MLPWQQTAVPVGAAEDGVELRLLVPSTFVVTAEGWDHAVLPALAMTGVGSILRCCQGQLTSRRWIVTYVVIYFLLMKTLHLPEAIPVPKIKIELFTTHLSKPWYDTEKTLLFYSNIIVKNFGFHGHRAKVHKTPRSVLDTF